MNDDSTEIALGDVITETKAGFASGTNAPDGVLQVRMNNVTSEGALDFTKERRVPADTRTPRFELRQGDVLFNATNSPDLVGKSALFRGADEPVVFSNHFLRIRTDPARLLPDYLARWLHFQFRRGVFASLAQRWVNQAAVRPERLLRLSFSLPTLEQQRRVARILDSADSVRAKRRLGISVGAHLPPAIYRATEADLVGDPVPLGDVASIASGITKGRRLNGQEVVDVPYLAVSNVQAGRLDLRAVKRIEATPMEIDRYRLEPGDLLLTEGGDPDKLGRGALWTGELGKCIHQNHIFRVRVHDADVLDPVFLQAQVAAPAARAYFLRSARQTTGIASINKRQLSALPVQVPSPASQLRFVEQVRAAERAVGQQRRHLEVLDELFASLQSRAFSGQL